MKKERIKKFIGYTIIILLGVGAFYLMCLRAEQIDKGVQCEKTNKRICETINKN